MLLLVYSSVKKETLKEKHSLNSNFKNYRNKEFLPQYFELQKMTH